MKRKSIYIVLLLAMWLGVLQLYWANVVSIETSINDGDFIKSWWYNTLRERVLNINSAWDWKNIWIGKAPLSSYKLDVNWNVNSSWYCIDWDCKTSWAPNTPWTISWNNIYYTWGNVGIGTSNPVAKLDIVWTTKIDQWWSYDVWIQWWNVTSWWWRNLAMLWVKSTDTLIINHGWEYAWWTNIMWWLTVWAAVPPKEALDVHWDIISNWANTWKFHTPDDWRASLYFWRGANWVISEWPVEFRDWWTIAAWAFIYNSDKRLKTNIKDLNDSNDILKISAKRFDWKDEKNKQVPKNDIWVIAQDVEKYFPEFVETNENWIKAVNYPKLVVPLIWVVKDQQTQIKKQNKEIENLKNEINNIKKLLINK